MSTVHPLASLAVILALLAVFAHIAGNALGTRLRENGDLLARRGDPFGEPAPAGDRNEASERDPFEQGAVREKARRHASPVTSLGRSDSLRWVHLATIASGATAGCGFGLWLGQTLWKNAASGAFGLGLAGCIILGALAGFLCGSFLMVAFQAHREAAKPPGKPPPAA